MFDTPRSPAMADRAIRTDSSLALVGRPRQSAYSASIPAARASSRNVLLIGLHAASILRGSQRDTATHFRSRSRSGLRSGQPTVLAKMRPAIDTRLQHDEDDERSDRTAL